MFLLDVDAQKKKCLTIFHILATLSWNSAPLLAPSRSGSAKQGRDYMAIDFAFGLFSRNIKEELPAVGYVLPHIPK